jgi:hypothetical protein
MERNKLICAVLLAIGLIPVSASAHVIKGQASPSGDIRPNLMKACDPGEDPDPPFDDYAISNVSIGNKVLGVSSSALRIGRNPQEVNDRFVANVTDSLKNGSTDRIISRLTDRELKDLADLVHQKGTKIQTQALLDILAERLSDKSLLRIAGTFGKEETLKSVDNYASDPVKASFLQKISYVTMVPTTLELTPMAGPAPNLDMTLRQIYLEYRLQTVGGLSARSAMAETAMYADSPLGWSAGMGYAVGTGINYLIETYDPSLSDAIGGTIANMWDASKAAASDVTRGQYQSAFDELFGYPVTNSGDPSGDGGIADPMEDYYWASGYCL